MPGDILKFSGSLVRERPSIRGRIEEIIALLQAIDAGEFLSAMPECEDAQGQHKIAAVLLAIAERELIRLHGDILE